MHNTIRIAHRRGLQRWSPARGGRACGRVPAKARAASGRRDGEGEAAWVRLVDSMSQTICMYKH